jgi:hypothetical protein
MAWDKKYIQQGVIIYYGEELNVNIGDETVIEINVDRPIVNAVWSGNCLNIKISNGTILRYADEQNFVVINQ